MSAPERDDIEAILEREGVEAFLEREKELRFQPHLEIDVPRETFERVLERAGMGDVDADEFSPFSSTELNAFEDIMLDYYAPTFTWRVVDDEDSADDSDEQWFPWDDSMDGRSE
jgi:hypothetical protein